MRQRHERWAKRNRSAARNLTSLHPPEESSPVDALSNASEADCSPEADAQSKALEQGSLILTEVEVNAQQFTLTCVAETQTDPVCCKGPLQLMLSATDGTHGSTQVTHVAQADKVTHPEKTWARRCGFLGYESVKSSEQALQDLCSVTMTVFSILLNLMPEQRSPNLPNIAGLATGCRCEVDDFISQAHLCRINDPGLAGQTTHEVCDYLLRCLSVEVVHSMHMVKQCPVSTHISKKGRQMLPFNVGGDR
ncbi:uncharacterized protein LOC144175442 [Haemaphysalis longicornis]